ncbi:hypothetical protein DFH08DRAFT_803778 [Mycena albidolilacea]|uniref:Uncharacterized protein n=1 Tax=Mycena albidolilacea TaxID=1033008 RepID=A0AAD7ADZ0_9AGAR|nr:hypothetical protein DFH08DRAFT_803778 [Mycena albidolilacea]
MVKTELVDDILVPHSPGSYSGHSSLFLLGMDPEIEEISQKDYNEGTPRLYTNCLTIYLPLMGTNKDISTETKRHVINMCCNIGCKQADITAHLTVVERGRSEVDAASNRGVEEESNGDYFPFLQPVTLSFVYDPDNRGGAHALSSIANPVSTSSIIPSASSSNPSTCF